MSQRTQSRTLQSLQKYVMGGIFVWALFVLSFPLAYFRVSRTSPYQGVPFISLGEKEMQKSADTY